MERELILELLHLTELHFIEQTKEVIEISSIRGPIRQQLIDTLLKLVLRDTGE